MGQSLHLERYAIRTDLALEAREMVQQQRGDGSHIPGVDIHEYEDNGITVSWITISEGEGSEALGKQAGTYLTLEVPGLRSKDSELQQRVATKFAKEFERFLQKIGIGNDAKVLIVGLGNKHVTADALGPTVVSHLLITQHLFELSPEQVEPGYRPVCAIAPGVLGTTGIETSDIVCGVAERVRPDFIIAIDSLASRALERVNTTIQVADTGIRPGSGIGNKRKGLTRDVLGVPVIAVGIPTVVDAVTIAHDTIDYVLANLNREMTKQKPKNPLDPADRPNLKELRSQQVKAETRERMLGVIGTLSDDEKRELIHEVLHPLGQNLIVTPKEVDVFIEEIGNVVANGLNGALHQSVDMTNVAAYTH